MQKEIVKNLIQRKTLHTLKSFFGYDESSVIESVASCGVHPVEMILLSSSYDINLHEYSKRISKYVYRSATYGLVVVSPHHDTFIQTSAIDTVVDDLIMNGVLDKGIKMHVVM